MRRVITLVFVTFLMAATTPIALASGGDYIYTFNAADQLVEVSSGGSPVAAFTYDGDNLRIKKITSSAETIYVRGAAGEVLAEYTKSGELLAEYAYLDGKRLCKITTNEKGIEHRIYYHDDLVGTPLALTNDSGVVVARGENFPFGEDATANTIPGPHKFTGKELDEEIGLYYFNARYYDAQLGRFMSVDPVGGGIANPQSWNRYAYVLNNPLKFIDPSGAAHLAPNSTSGEIRWVGDPSDEVVVTADDPSPTVSEIRSTALRVAGAGARPDEIPSDPILENGSITAGGSLPLGIYQMPGMGSVPIPARLTGSISITTGGVNLNLAVSPGASSPSGYLVATETMTLGQPVGSNASGSVDYQGGAGLFGGGEISSDAKSYISFTGKVGVGFGQSGGLGNDLSFPIIDDYSLISFD